MQSYIAHLVSSKTAPARFVLCGLEGLDHLRVRAPEARSLVDAREAFADELNVDRILVGGERVGVVRVEQREVQQVGFARVDVGDKLLALADLPEALDRVGAVVCAPVEKRDERESRLLGLAFERLELRSERTEARKGQDLDIAVCEGCGRQQRARQSAMTETHSRCRGPRPASSPGCSCGPWRGTRRCRRRTAPRRARQSEE